MTDFTAFPDNCLPPEGFFESRKALFESINTYARLKGYAFTTGKSTTEKTGRTTVTYACDRSRRQPDNERVRQGKRRTTIRMTECPFSVLAKETNNGWVLKHRFGIRHAFHNHEPSLHPSAHPIHHQLLRTPELKAFVKAGLVLKKIQTVIRESGFLTTRQDIYNQIAEIQQDSHEGQSPSHALTNQLEEKGFWSHVQYGPERHITSILFAHPKSLIYLRAYPKILLLDCTYKTNKYGIPLLNIINVDTTRRSFCIAFAFLSGEAEEDYMWALERLKTLYK